MPIFHNIWVAVGMIHQSSQLCSQSGDPLLILFTLTLQIVEISPSVYSHCLLNMHQSCTNVSVYVCLQFFIRVSIRSVLLLIMLHY